MIRVPLTPATEVRVALVHPPGCEPAIDLRLFRHHHGAAEALATAAGLRVPPGAIPALVAALEAVTADTSEAVRT